MEKECVKPKPANVRTQLTAEAVKKLRERQQAAEERALKTYYGGTNPND